MKHKRYTAYINGYCLSYDSDTTTYESQVDSWDEAASEAYAVGDMDYSFSVSCLIDNVTGERYTSYTDFKRKTQ